MLAFRDWVAPAAVVNRMEKSWFWPEGLLLLEGLTLARMSRKSKPDTSRLAPAGISLLKVAPLADQAVFTWRSRFPLPREAVWGSLPELLTTQ